MTMNDNPADVLDSLNATALGMECDDDVQPTAQLLRDAALEIAELRRKLEIAVSALEKYSQRERRHSSQWSLDIRW